MSEDKTAASPDESREKLLALRAEKTRLEAAEAKKAAEAAQEEADAEFKKTCERPLHHVLVRHMGRSPRTRTMRAARSGHRRQGVLLDDGSRIRRKGKKRLTELDLRAFVDNHRRLMEYVRVGTIEILDAWTEFPVSYNDLKSRLIELGDQVVKERNEEAKEAHKAAVEAAKAAGAEPPPPPKELGFVLDESGLQQDPVGGSDKVENTAPSDALPPAAATDPWVLTLTDAGKEPTAVVRILRESLGMSITNLGELGKLPVELRRFAGEGDATSLIMGLQEAGATVNLTREEVPTPSAGEGGGEESLTEDELLKKSRSDLNGLAKEYGVKKPEKMASKQSVVDAIFKAAEVQGEG